MSTNSYAEYGTVLICIFTLKVEEFEVKVILAGPPLQTSDAGRKLARSCFANGEKESFSMTYLF